MDNAKPIIRLRLEQLLLVLCEAKKHPVWQFLHTLGLCGFNLYKQEVLGCFDVCYGFDKKHNPIDALKKSTVLDIAQRV